MTFYTITRRQLIEFLGGTVADCGAAIQDLDAPLVVSCSPQDMQVRDLGLVFDDNDMITLCAYRRVDDTVTDWMAVRDAKIRLLEAPPPDDWPLYKKEFPEGGITVPEFLLRPPYVDRSWKNDVCPSFTRRAEHGTRVDYKTEVAWHLAVVVWVNYDELKRRECGGLKYSVVEIEVSDDGDRDDLDEVLLETEDPIELKRYLDGLETVEVEFFTGSWKSLGKTEAVVEDPYEPTIEEITGAYAKAQSEGATLTGSSRWKVYYFGRQVGGQKEGT